MIDDKNQYQEIIQKKCPFCFEKDECMLLPSQRATLCLGPFKDENDSLEKIRADNEGEVTKSKARKAWLKKQEELNRYLWNKKFLSDWQEIDD